MAAGIADHVWNLEEIASGLRHSYASVGAISRNRILVRSVDYHPCRAAVSCRALDAESHTLFGALSDSGLRDRHRGIIPADRVSCGLPLSQVLPEETAFKLK